MPALSARERFLSLVQAAIRDGTLVKLTLGKPHPKSPDSTLRNLFVRPVRLKSGPHLTFVWRHTTRDITKNLDAEEAVAIISTLLGWSFLDAHLFTPVQTAQLETVADGDGRLRIKLASSAPAVPSEKHDHEKTRLVPTTAGWLRDLGVTNDRGQPREGMAAKLRQIERFSEILQHLLTEAGLLPDPTADKGEPAPDAPTLAAPLNVADMGCGKGYLTFATATLLGNRANVTGIENRTELVGQCNRISVTHGLRHLQFIAGEIASVVLEPAPDVLLALHACDTATDDALARGVAAGSRLIVVSPCCQKELRPQLIAPSVLADALQHGIFRERQAEFVTDALRAQLLEWAGYRTKVFEFVSTEHTAKNVMIAAIRDHAPFQPARLERLRAFGAFYGIKEQRLARHLQVNLTA